MDADTHDRRQQVLRRIPSVDRLLELPASQKAIALLSRPVVVKLVRRVIDDVRRGLLEAELAQEELIRGEPTNRELAKGELAKGELAKSELAKGGPVEADWERLLEEAFARAQRAGLVGVVNATGVVLHTNMGRAPLSPDALDSVRHIAQGYSNLEYDLEEGRRGSRDAHGERLLVELTGAEAAMVVNNNAAAVLLVLSAVAAGGEVILSRGEMIEIGGSFRIPEVMEQSGCRLVEVGTTNRTRIADYQAAVGPDTKALLKVHTSNYRVIGFTESVSVRELAPLAQSHGLYLIEDLGSGVLVPTERYGLAHEPTLQEAVAAGADLVTCSGDKLLGGPQAGIILGKKELVDRCRKHPLARALRVDKMTLAALEATLRLYAQGDAHKVPIWRMMAETPERLQSRAEAVRREIVDALRGDLESSAADGSPGDVGSSHAIDVVESLSTVGGGSLPGETLPTWVLRVRRAGSLVEVAKALRVQSPPVVGRVEDDALLFDLRTVDPGDDRIVAQAIVRALKAAGQQLS